MPGTRADGQRRRLLRTALALAAVAVGVVVVSGGASSDPRTPPALPGLPPPFLGTAVVGNGGLTAAIDSYGDVVDLRAPGPAGRALIDNPLARQRAGTVPSDTGIVPWARLGASGVARPLWRADWVRQRYLPDTNVLRTEARFGSAAVAIDWAAQGGRLGCRTRVRTQPNAAIGDGSAPSKESARVELSVNLVGGEERVHCGDAAGRRIVSRAVAADRRWVARARPLGPSAPRWATRMYRRALLAMRALTDGANGAVAAGARDEWAYVWPRDAAAVALAFTATGYRPEARQVASFLRGLDLDAAARFDGHGDPVPGRPAQGDAQGWAAAATRATGLPPAALSPSNRRADQGAGPPPQGEGDTRSNTWRNRADYQEKAPGDYLANALATPTFIADGPISREIQGKSARRRREREVERLFGTRRGLVRVAGKPDSGLDSAAAWAVRPFPQPRLFPAVRRTLERLLRQGGRFGIVPSEDWPDADPWTAPTAWSAWSLAALARIDSAEGEAAPRSTLAERDREAALRLLGDLRRAATPTGLLPERVSARTGLPTSTTPLAWSEAFAVLALRQLWPATRND